MRIQVLVRRMRIQIEEEGVPVYEDKKERERSDDIMEKTGI